ncbi:MAG: hypothetical protein MUC83_14710 [Pirellula sp.]|nr:hypothetical protein [Pirellula sp.]
MKIDDRLVEKAMNETHETEDILRRMGEIRDELDEGVQEIVERAREMKDWRTYVQAYPWLFLGSAVVAGYLMVPRRRNRNNTTPASQSSGSKVTQTLGFVGMMVMREVLSQIARQASQSLMTSLTPTSTSDSQTPQDIEP